MDSDRSHPRVSPHGINHDDDATVGMGFSITITVLTLLGLLFCFRRASMLLPRNLSIQLQMFGQNNDNDNSTRGPIALTDDDMTGATGLDWEDLEAQLQDEEETEELEDIQPVSRAQRPKKQVRYADDIDGDEDAAKPLTMSSSGPGGRFTVEDDSSDEDGVGYSVPYRVAVKDEEEEDGEEERVRSAKEPARTEVNDTRTNREEPLLQEETL
ncbi:hypothetical protein EC968_007373 [Mortierella alpina]|nr:hypothetical protein EC968_007373 [Mortierella alpina]